ncbi:MAG: NADH-quinone oxidoreductase subunit C [Acidobacteria bacterium]|nr:NADH-quinone oxidoreductase subunit C [Acidobacteriota bacterium]
MSLLCEDLQSRFGGRVYQVSSESREQICIRLEGVDVRDVTDYLRRQFSARVVTVFAEDRTAPEGVFYNYYVFECPGDPCYLVLQVPIPAAEPRFPSLAADLPALNWQEREIQDWFGL